MATWYVVLTVCSSCVPLNSNTNTSSHSSRRTGGGQAPASGACALLPMGRCLQPTEQYNTYEWRVSGTQHTVYNSIFDYLSAIVYELYNRRIHTRWCVTSIQCIRSTRSAFLHSVQHTITACKQYTLHSLSGTSFSYRNTTPHLFDFVLLRFVKWVLRAYKCRQLRR